MFVNSWFVCALSVKLIWEARAVGPSRRSINYGKLHSLNLTGAWLNMEVCRRGMIAHYNDNKDNRWLVPLSMLSIRAVSLTRPNFKDFSAEFLTLHMEP